MASIGPPALIASAMGSLDRREKRKADEDVDSMAQNLSDGNSKHASKRPKQ